MSISSTDLDAIQALEAKIMALETRRSHYKDLNRRCRSGDADAIREVTSISGRTSDCGFPPSILTNLGAEIRRSRSRIDEIRALIKDQQVARELGGVSLSEADGWCTVVFASKPESLVVSALRAASYVFGHGRWSGARTLLPQCVASMMSTNKRIP